MSALIFNFQLKNITLQPQIRIASPQTAANGGNKAF
jgi:hypothetical protein